MAGRKHDWKERTEEGEMMLYRGTYFGGKWEIIRRLKSEEFWEKLDPPNREQLLSLREIIEPKYRRKRIPWEALDLVDRMLEDLELEEVGLSGEEE